MPKVSGYPNKSSFVIAVPLPFSSPFNSKHKNAFIWVTLHFWHMFDKTKVARMVTHTSLCIPFFPILSFLGLKTLLFEYADIYENYGILYKKI